MSFCDDAPVGRECKRLFCPIAKRSRWTRRILPATKIIFVQEMFRESIWMNRLWAIASLWKLKSSRAAKAKCERGRQHRRFPALSFCFAAQCRQETARDVFAIRAWCVDAVLWCWTHSENKNWRKTWRIFSRPCGACQLAISNPQLKRRAIFICACGAKSWNIFDSRCKMFVSSFIIHHS